MSTCTLRLYSGLNWELLPEKLLIVDAIEDYLATKTATQLNNFQYIKNQLELSIVINASQLLSQPKNASYKYVRVYDDDSGYIYYYYVKKASWTAQNSVRLELVMDVLNTFQEGTHYSFKDNTRIIREHKDRYIIHEDNAIVTLVCEVLNEDWYPDVNDDPTIETYPEAVEIAQAQVLEADTQTAIWTLKLNVFRGDISGLQRGDKINIISENNENAIVEVDSIETLKEYFRKIDEVDENINPLLQCGNAQGVKIENNKTKLQGDWYLLYRNQKTPDDSLTNPVECYLIPDEDIEVDSGIINAGRLVPTALQNSYYYGLIIGDKGYTAMTNVTITLDNGHVISPSVATDWARTLIIKRNADNTLSVWVTYGSYISNYQDTEVEFVGQCQYLTFSSMPVTFRYGSTLPTGTTPDIVSKLVGGAWLEGLETLTNSTSPAYIDNVSKVDKTDAKNIKLIKLPYCPYDFTISSDKLVVSSDSNWDYIKLTQASGSTIYCLKLNDLNTDLHASISLSDGSKEPLIDLKRNFTPSLTDSRKGAEYESKLYHSEFYKPSYVYDSFTYSVELEKLNIASYYDGRNLTIYFDMTKTINSKFMFTFESLVFRISNQSYAKYLPIARNNEEVLYNVPYINYIRTGYNYDVKQKNLSTASNWIGVGLSVASIGASLLMPTAPLKVAGVVGSLVSMAMSIKGAVVSTIQGEDNIRQKLLQAQNQTSSVSGSDDVDLMSIYAENRLKYLIYQPRDITKNLLYDLFYYAGYNSGRMGIPNHNTRVNFDYLEADISIQKTTAIPQDCLAELINAFKTGVTYLHKTSRSSNKWDFAQTLENWEKIFFE